jgi:hypothetical protein
VTNDARQKRSDVIEWMRQHPRYPHPIANEAFTMVMSTTIRNWLHFSVANEDLGHYTARDLIWLRSLLALNDTLIKIAHTRAIIDDDSEAMEIIGQLGVGEAARYWLTWFRQCPKNEVEAQLRSLQETGPADTLWTARLVAVRGWPDLFALTWLRECPANLPRVAFYLCEIALKHGVAADDIAAFLRERPDILVSIDPDRLLMPVVAHSKQAPALTLRGFEAFASEALSVAAARWHFDHGDFAQAAAATKNFRFLSRHADDAFLLLGLSLVEMKQLAEAADVVKKLTAKAHIGNLQLAIAEKDPPRVATDILINLATDCSEQQPELFYRTLICLLKKNCLAEARRVCEQKSQFAGHPTLGPIMAKILPAKS